MDSANRNASFRDTNAEDEESILSDSSSNASIDSDTSSDSEDPLCQDSTQARQDLSGFLSQAPVAPTLSLMQRRIFIAPRGFAFCCTCSCPGVLVPALSIDLAGPTHVLAPLQIGHDLESIAVHFREVHMILQIGYSTVSSAADDQPPSSYG